MVFRAVSSPCVTNVTCCFNLFILLCCKLKLIKRFKSYRMKLLKTLIFLFSISLFTANSFAQLPDGSIAPDFTLVDENGTTHNLYSLLDEGKTVFIDLFAVWCPPCWTYKQTGAMEDLYVQHGPIDYPGVNANSTNDVMFFAIEADGNDCACLTGSCSSSTEGNWIEGTSYPTICLNAPANLSSNLADDYATWFFWPYIYMICPDKTTTFIGSHANPYSLVGDCVTITDNQGPDFSGTPSLVNVPCDDTNAFNEITASLTDPCTPITLTFVDVNTGLGCGGGDIARTYSAIDGCGNISTFTQTISFTDSTPPIFTSVPSDITIPCDSGLTDFGIAFVSDNCSQVNPTTDVVIVGGPCPEAYEIHRTFTALDDCGNSSSYTQVIFVEASVAVGCPADVDNDGAVTVNDLLAVLSEFGCTTFCQYDLDMDGIIGVTDILDVLAAFGTIC